MYIWVGKSPDSPGWGKRMKLIQCVFIFLFLLLPFSLLSDQENQYIDIPFIQQVNEVENGNLDKGSLKLIVNGHERKIMAVNKVEKSLKRKCIFGREFLLSFLSDSVCARLRNAISYFISDVMGNNDSLIILTPLKAYRIKVGNNKLKAIDNIVMVVTADCKTFSIKKTAIEADLRQRIKNIYSIISKKNNFYNNSKNSSILFQFLNSFPSEYKMYHELTTILDPGKLKKIVSLFKDSASQKWWIHFSREDISGITGEVRNLMEILGTAVNRFSYVKATNYQESNQKGGISPKDTLAVRDDNYEMKTASFLKSLRKVIGYHEISGRSDLLSEMLLSRICFNSIIFESESGSVLKSVMRERSIPAFLLRRISLWSGGISINAKDPEKMIRSVAVTDMGYHTLTFPLHKNENSLQIKIQSRSGASDNYFYPETIGEEQLRSVVRNKKTLSCRIRDLRIGTDSVSFRIDRFCRKVSGDFGLLKVSLCVNDKNGAVVYSRENTLRSKKGGKKISLSVKIPDVLKGKHTLNLSVVDLIAKSSSKLQQKIEFK